MRFLVIPILFSLFSFEAKSQVDFTSPLLSSGQYQTPKAARPPSRTPASESQRPPSAENELVSSPLGKTLGETSVSPLPDEEPSLSEQWRVLRTGEDEKLARFYYLKIHPDDVRQNRVEIQVATGMSSLGAKSDYSVRDYEMSASEVDIRSNVWFTPLLGLSGDIRFTMGAKIDMNGTTGGHDPVRDETVEVGVKARRFFGLSKLSPSVEMNLFYLDENFGVASQSNTRLRTRSSGLGLAAKGSFPSSESMVWTLGGSLAPSLNHRESSTAFEGRSGTPAESLAYALNAGGEYRMSRGSQILYGLEYKVERNSFDGLASVADPVTGETPSNVTATTTRLLFSLGYRWGR